MMRDRLATVGIAMLLVLPATAAPPRTPIVQLTIADRNDLRDPFFVLVLARDPRVTSLAAIEDLIQPDADNRVVFVVDESIADPSRPESRRAVLAFKGRNGGFSRLDPNVMLSVSFGSDGFRDEPSLIEAWGWDESRGRYNYYSLEEITPQTKRWIFQGTSDDLDLPPAQRGRCLECHRSGAPIMKELKFPWNNWHSPVAFQAGYLLPGQESWPVASELQRRNLEGAEKLEEDFLLPSLRRFNQARIVRDRRLDREGRGLIVDARRILRPLFVPSEFNLATAGTGSGMHPLAPNPPGAPSRPIQPPDTFFLNRDLIAGNRRLGIDGLEIDAATRFGEDDVFEVSPDEYVGLVEGSGQRLSTFVGGDTVFAWLTPEPAYSDVHLIDQLMHEGIVPAHFVAAVLAIDLENPLISAERGRLLAFIPDSFNFEEGTPAAEHELVVRTIANLEVGELTAEGAETRFLERLRSPDAVEALRRDVDAVVARLTAALSAESGERAATLERLYGRLLARRHEVVEDPDLSLVVESELLLPLR